MRERARWVVPRSSSNPIQVGFQQTQVQVHKLPFESRLFLSTTSNSSFTRIESQRPQGRKPVAIAGRRRRNVSIRGKRYGWVRLRDMLCSSRNKTRGELAPPAARLTAVVGCPPCMRLGPDSPPPLSPVGLAWCSDHRDGWDLSAIQSSLPLKQPSFRTLKVNAC